MKEIHTREELQKLSSMLGGMGDWHEPDQQEVTAEFAGHVFDNAGYWPEPSYSGIQEMHVIIKKEGEPVAAVNLATLFAWATGYKGWED